MGHKAGEQLTTSSWNTFVGVDAGSDVTTSGNGCNTALGYQAFKEASGDVEYNTAIGYGALWKPATAVSKCIALGHLAGRRFANNENLAIGHEALGEYTTNGISGTKNLAIGNLALHYARDGGYNTAVGHGAGKGTNSAIGNNNCFFGNDAGETITSGSANICIGAAANTSSPTVSNECTIGANYGTNRAIDHFRIPGIGCSISEGGAVITGIVTATSFVGSGANLTGLPAGITINNNANNRIITGSGTANTLEGESTLTYDGTNLDLSDSKTIRFGNSNDLDGTSRIKNHTGDLHIGNWAATNADSNVYIRARHDENSIVCADDGTVELYFDNVKKFETSATGATLTGHLIIDSSSGSAIHIPDGQNLQIGTGHDIKISHNGSNSFFENLTGYLEFQGASNEKWMRMNQNGSVDLYHDNIKKASTVSEGLAIYGTEGASGELYIYADENDDNADKWRLKADHVASGFYIQNKNSGSWEDSLQCFGDGAVRLFHNNSEMFYTSASGCHVGRPSAAAHLHFLDGGIARFGSSNDLEIYHDASHSRIKTASNATGNLVIDSNNDINLRVNNSEMSVHCKENGAVELYYDNSKKLATASNGVSVWGDLMIESDNNILYLGSGSDLRIWHDGSHSHIRSYTGELRIEPDNGQTLSINNQANNVDSAKFIIGGSVELYENNSKKLETTTSGVTVTGEVDATSDIKLKENIKTIENSLDKVLQLRGVEFDWKETKDSSIGLIAQEVEEVLPELVHETDDIKSVSYGNITAVLIEAIKEQNEIINNMKKEIEALKNS